MKYTFCPILLEKFEYPRTNGQSKAGVSKLLLSAKHVFVSNNTVFGERQAPS